MAITRKKMERAMKGMKWSSSGKISRSEFKKALGKGSSKYISDKGGVRLKKTAKKSFGDSKSKRDAFKKQYKKVAQAAMGANEKPVASYKTPPRSELNSREQNMSKSVQASKPQRNSQADRIERDRKTQDDTKSSVSKVGTSRQQLERIGLSGSRIKVSEREQSSIGGPKTRGYAGGKDTRFKSKRKTEALRSSYQPYKPKTEAEKREEVVQKEKDRNKEISSSKKDMKDEAEKLAEKELKDFI